MKRLAFVVFLISSLLPYTVFPQQNKTVPALLEIDSLKGVLKTQSDDGNKVNILNKLSNEHELLANYDSALLYARNAQTLAEKIEFKKGVGDALGNIGVIYYRRSNYQKSLEYQFKAFTIYQDIGSKQGIANALGNIGLTYYTLGNYSQALECYFKVLSIAREIEDKDVIANISSNIGIIYGEQGNYAKALKYLFKSLVVYEGEGDKVNMAIDLGNVGYSYLAKGDYPKALEYDFKAVAQAQGVGDKAVIANFLGDIGNIYYEMGDYTRALEYDFKAVSIARKIGDIDDMANLYSNTGKVYTKLNNYIRAKKFLDSALNLSQKTGNKKNIKITYRNLSTLDSATGNYKTAYSDYKKYMAYRDSVLNRETTQMEISYEFEKREDSIKAEYEKENIIKTDEINRKKILNDSAIVILALTVLSAILLINKQRIKRRKDKIISEKEKDMLLLKNQHMEMEKQHMEDELVNAKKALEDHMRSMVEKNELLERFKADIEKLKNLKSKELEEVRVEQLEHLNKTTILTEDDWDKFKELFEQVYKGFFIRLKEKLPDLSQAEIRLVCLTKLRLNTKQMADTLGVSRDAIWKIHHRLRKKLDISENKDIIDIIESI